MHHFTSKKLVEQSIYGLDMDFPYFHMMQSLIDQQFVAMERNPSLATFLKQLQLTNILTGMYDHYSRMQPIKHWRHVIIWFSFATHLLKERPHFEFSIRDFLCHLLRRIEWNTDLMGGWEGLKAWCQFVNADRMEREQLQMECEQYRMVNELDETPEAHI